MKKFFLNNLKVIISVLISGVFFTCIGAYAAIQYYAKDISYNPANENFDVDNVQDAINELYEKNFGCKSVKLNSAAFDEIYYYEYDSKKVLGKTDEYGYLDACVPKVNSLTLYSSVAKDINNSSEYYSKNFTDLLNLEEINLMPDGALYWYGNFCNSLENGGSEMAIASNEWFANYPGVGVYTINTPIVSGTTFIATSSSGRYASGIGTKNRISSKYKKMHVLTKTVTGAWISTCNSKNIMDSVSNFTLSSNTKNTWTVNPNNNFIHIHTDNNREFQMNAWWLE